MHRCRRQPPGFNDCAKRQGVDFIRDLHQKNWKNSQSERELYEHSGAMANSTLQFHRPVHSLEIGADHIHSHPRPETAVVFSAVLKAGRKIRSRISRGVRLAARSAVTSLRSIALANMRAGSMPAPSSDTLTRV